MKVMRTSRRRKQSGFTIVEVVATSFLLVLFAVFTANLCILIFGATVNDKACRDVVRVAAQQPNASKALLFAQASVNNHRTDGTFISPIQLINGVDYHDYGGSPPAGETPYVSVTTAVTVTLPAPIYVFGSSFTNQMEFRQKYTSPIVKSKHLLP